jgi:hypothetical protein
MYSAMSNHSEYVSTRVELAGKAKCRVRKLLEPHLDMGCTGKHRHQATCAISLGVSAIRKQQYKSDLVVKFI